jgi:hypothetical protein
MISLVNLLQGGIVVLSCLLTPVVETAPLTTAQNLRLFKAGKTQYILTFSSKVVGEAISNKQESPATLVKMALA